MSVLPTSSPNDRRARVMELVGELQAVELALRETQERAGRLITRRAAIIRLLHTYGPGRPS